MLIYRSVNYEHFDSWQELLLENREVIEKNCNESNIRFMKSLNLPYTIWNKKTAISSFHISVFNNIVTFEYESAPNKKYSMTMPYPDFLMFFIEN